MSGHSKWKTIQKTKNANDAKRGKLFSKLSKDIEIATRIGESGDPNFNPMLRIIMDKAKSSNMTNDKIENAINKGLGISNSDEVLYENTYEVYGPGNVAILVDCETDNTNRTLTELRTAVNKAGGKLVSEGSISWQFHELGLIELKPLNDTVDIDTIVLKAMELEAISDVKNAEDKDEKPIVRVFVEKNSLKSASDSIRDKVANLATIESVELIKEAKDTIELSDEDAEGLMNFIGIIEDLQDVISVWHNAI